MLYVRSGAMSTNIHHSGCPLKMGILQEVHPFSTESEIGEL